ncbi:MAG TPA: 4-(cytidine 5'-diphospho)-2-C-methyl-D-erythritol kinase [Bacteroidales bacterium]|jgi:4-diphosphocytidyl-2-C-methyl-D-erythritol kinase|nr:4-(cytidine 5'-diphospho)-2-C-methyl-D-erythritol kinase [Bacteroidales bacterium]
MISFPNCKINIGLNILRRRPDGFHDIETLFCPVDLTDVLEFIPLHRNGNVNLTVSGLAVDCPPDKNLCIKAYELLKTEYNLPPLDVHLHKVIPSGAGLGGGSSDAAFMLNMLSDIFELHLKEDDLCEYASRLGSDCAFFIKNRPMLGFGRGNLFKEINPIPADLEIIIVHPGIHISTAEAYAGVIPAMPTEKLEKLISLPIEDWKDLIINDFEESIIRKYPLIGKLKTKFYEMGAIYASMSGSGSSVYGLFSGAAPSPGAHFPGMFTWKGKMMK